MPKNIRIEVDATELHRPRPPKSEPKLPVLEIYMPFNPHVALMEALTRLTAAGARPKPSKPTAPVNDFPLARDLEHLCERRGQESVAAMLGYNVRSIRRWIKSAKFSDEARAAVTNLLQKTGH
jgi:hypothetical protein